MKTNYVKFRIHAEKDHLCFYKNSTNQTLNLSAAKQFTSEASRISSIAPLGNEVDTAIKCSISLPDN